MTPLELIFKRSLFEGVVPTIWKTAFITPVFKKGDKSKVEQYRPISKLCLFAKIFERIIYDQTYAALRTSFTEEQHGFLKSRSTVSNLLLATNYITKSMEGGAQIDVVYTDYSKCFDRIDHNLLMRKLAVAGIHGDLYRWFKSYIENRSQAVVLQGFTSKWTSIPSGVPQGSLLGPLMFVIFINDINSCFISSKILLYADDMKILKPIYGFDEVLDLQSDLLRFEAYCVTNKLDLNVDKCYLVSFTRKHTLIDQGYQLKGRPITRVSEVCDLGVLFDNKLTFEKHVNSCVSKASRALGFIIRTSTSFKSLKSLKILYCAFVRSHLEYASQVWNPRYEIYKSRIEGIQKKFLRFLDFKARQRSRDYEHRCRRYHFLPLHQRRDINDVAYLAGIANGSVDCPQLLTEVSLWAPSRVSRSSKPLYIPWVSTQYRQNAYIIRASHSFNEISNSNALDIDLFCTKPSTIRKVMTQDYFTNMD